METKDDVVTFESRNTRKLAYYLRQAIRFVNNSQNTKYGLLQFTVKEVNNAVICIRKVDFSGDLVSATSDYGTIITGINSVESVIGYIITNDSITRGYFSEFEPNPNQLELLKKWGAVSNITFDLKNRKLSMQRNNA